MAKNEVKETTVNFGVTETLKDLIMATSNNGENREELRSKEYKIKLNEMKEKVITMIGEQLNLLERELKETNINDDKYDRLVRKIDSLTDIVNYW